MSPALVADAPAVVAGHAAGVHQRPFGSYPARKRM